MNRTSYGRDIIITIYCCTNFPYNGLVLFTDVNDDGVADVDGTIFIRVPTAGINLENILYID